MEVESSIFHETEELTRLIQQKEEFQRLFQKSTSISHFKQLTNNVNMKIFPIDDYGAIGDGKNNDTGALLAAITACSSSGSTGVPSAVILSPMKVYNTFPFYLQSFCSLFIPVEATLQASDDISNWPVVNNNSSYENYMNAIGLQSISIFGGGSINGQGEVWWSDYNYNLLPYHRPYLTHLGINNFLIEGITIINSPMFNIFLYQSTNVKANEITILAPYTSPNTDGFDTELSSNVHLSNSIIINGDDGVAVKRNSNNILIENVLFGGGHGLSIGSVQNNNDYIQNITFRHCISYSQTYGPRIKTTNDATGFVSDVLYQNISIYHARNQAIILTEFYGTSKKRNLFQLKNNNINIINMNNNNDNYVNKNVINISASSSLIVVKNITYEDVNAFNIEFSSKQGELDCIQASPCENLSFNNVNMHGPNIEPWNCSNAFGTHSHCIPPIRCLHSSPSFSGYLNNNIEELNEYFNYDREMWRKKFDDQLPRWFVELNQQWDY